MDNNQSQNNNDKDNSQREIVMKKFWQNNINLVQNKPEKFSFRRIHSIMKSDEDVKVRKHIFFLIRISDIQPSFI